MTWKKWNPNLVGLAAAGVAFAMTGSLLLPLGVMAAIALGGFFAGREGFKTVAKTR